MNKPKFTPPSLIQVGYTEYNIELSAGDKDIKPMVLGMLDVMRDQATISAEMYARLERLKKGYQNLIELDYVPLRLHDEMEEIINETEALLAKARCE